MLYHLLYEFLNPLGAYWSPLKAFNVIQYVTFRTAGATLTALEETRQMMNRDRGSNPKLTLLPFLITALSRGLAEWPMLNATFDDEAMVVTRHGAVQMGAHRFFNNQEKENGPSRFSKFVHTWKWENGQWQLARVISLH